MGAQALADSADDPATFGRSTGPPIKEMDL